MKKHKCNRWMRAAVAAAAIAAISPCAHSVYAAETNPSGFTDDEDTGWTAGDNVKGGFTAVQWSGSYAIWQTSGNVSRYQVILYRNGEKVVKKYVKSQKKINLEEYLQEDGDYTFTVQAETSWGWTDPISSKVRTEKDRQYAIQGGVHTISEPSATGPVAPASSSETAADSSDGTQTVGASSETSETGGPSEVAQPAGQWLQAADGSGRWWYCYSDGTYPASAWLETDGADYYFDADGWMVTGAQEIDGTSYNFAESGELIQ